MKGLKAKVGAEESVPSQKGKRSFRQKYLAVFFHAFLIGGMLVVLHYLSLGEKEALAGLYSFLAVFTIFIVCWATFVEKQPLSYIGITGSNSGKSLLINILLAVTILGSFTSPNAPEQIVPYLVPALISALFEVVYIYGWIQKKMSENVGLTRSLIFTAFLYAIYHVGYYGLSNKGLDMFLLSFGLYMLVGFANAGILRYTGNLLSLWPFSLTLATAYDYQRVGLPISDQTGFLMVAAILMVVIIGAVAGVNLWQHKRPGSPDKPIIERKLSLRDHLKIDIKRYKKRFIKTFIFLLPLFILGLIIRFVVNDPVEGIELLPPVMARSFLPERSVMNEITLKFGFAFYLLIPVYCLLMGFDLGTRNLKAPVVLKEHGAQLDRFGERGIVSKAILMVLSTLLFAAVLFPFILGLSLFQGHIPTGSEFLRFGIVVSGIVIYSLLNFSIFGIISYAARSQKWFWFASSILYIFIYNWWMIYPLFSQYQAVGLPASNDPYVISNWMTSLWQRVVPLYAFVPHYNYYISLVVTYLKDVLDRTWLIAPISSLLGYTFSFFLIFLAYARKFAGYRYQRRSNSCLPDANSEKK
jgi:hypothetical protein